VVSAARALVDRSAKTVHVAATHAVLCGPAQARLADSLVRQVFVTDSIPLASLVDQLTDRIQVVSVAPLLGEAIRRIHEDASVSALFGKLP